MAADCWALSTVCKLGFCARIALFNSKILFTSKSLTAKVAPWIQNMKQKLCPSLATGILIAVLKKQFLNQKNIFFWQEREQKNREQ